MFLNGMDECLGLCFDEPYVFLIEQRAARILLKFNYFDIIIDRSYRICGIIDEYSRDSGNGYANLV